MFNERPIEDRNLAEGLKEVRAVLQRRGLAFGVMLISDSEGAFAYNIVTPWTAAYSDPASPMGFRIRSKAGNPGDHAKMEGALHAICQLSDFGAQTMDWMEQLKAMLRQAGVEFDHTPFGGKPLPSIMTQPKPR